MGKLFALEEMGVNATGAELETSPEEGEVADVQVDVEQEVGDIGENAEAIDEGMGAADQLEEVQDVVEQAAEEGEGLDPVAAESLRIAVEAICARVGANPKAIYSLYATENFQSASSRKANTRIALEGVSEFLKDMWKKIKAALERVWAKLKEFWNKHFSSLGRIKNALESMKKRVAASSGKLRDKAYIEEAPAGLAAMFVTKNDISAQTVEAFISAHVAAGKGADTAVNAGEEAVKAAAKATESADISGALKGAVGKKTGEFKLGSESAPLIGGVYITYNLKIEEEEEVSFEVERENVEHDDKVGVSITDKSAVVKIISDTLNLINADIKNKASFDKSDAEFKKIMLDIEKKINSTAKDAESAEKAKGIRSAVKVIYKIAAKVPSITAEKTLLDVKLAKGVLSYAALCLKNYK